jgi:uncharacterized protein (DUF58 family)
MARPVRLLTAATPKLKTYVAAGAFGLFAGLITGQPEVVAAAAPFLLAVILGLVATKHPEAELEVTVDEDRIIEGDEFLLRFTILSSGRAEVEMGLVLPRGMELLGTPRTLVRAAPAGQPITQEFRLRAVRWGAYKIGTLALRLYGPGHLVVYEGVFEGRQAMKVYPASERLRQSLPPLSTQLYSGDYTARDAGDGIEFSTVRPFMPGDSVKRVNWRVTSRRGSLHVNLAHPERDSDVVLFIDTFSDADLHPGPESPDPKKKTTLDLAVRGASAVAEHHLRHNDRVGLISFGGSLRWLRASMGRTHTYRLADFLLDVNATFSYTWKNIDLLPYGTLPSKAMIIALTPLEDDRVLRALADIYERGFDVIVINTLPEDEIPPGPSAEDRLAHRVWLLQREMRKARLVESGIPVISWAGDSSIEPILAAYPRRSGRQRIRA